MYNDKLVYKVVIWVFGGISFWKEKKASTVYNNTYHILTVLKLVFCVYLFKFIRLVEIGYFSWAEDIVDIFQESFLYNLSIHKQEHGWFVLYSCLPV